MRRMIIGTGAVLGLMLSSVGAQSAQEQQPRTPQQQGQEGSQPRTLDLNDLEKNPSAYIGQTVAIEGEVQEVFGPGTFTIDEENWVDLDGETLVYLDSPRAASLDDNDEVRVTGTVEAFEQARSTLEQGWGWTDDDDWVRDMSERPVIKATSVQLIDDADRLDWSWDFDSDAYGTYDDNVGVRYRYGEDAGQDPVRTLRDLTAAPADARLVGKRVELQNVTVRSSSSGNGVWVGSAGDELVLVRTHDGATGEGQQMPADVSPNDAVTIHGTVLSMPRHIRNTLREGGTRMSEDTHNEDIYILATKITKTS